MENGKALLVSALLGGFFLTKKSLSREDVGERRTSMPNSIKKVQTLDQLKSVAPFGLKIPTRIEGYERQRLAVIEGKIAEIIYTSEADTLTYRMGEGEEDISGDYNVYPIKLEASLEEQEGDVLLKGTLEAIYVATWSDGTYSYSLTSTMGLSPTDMIDIIQSIK